MAREPRITQNNFSAGEVSPRVHARIDLTKYKHGCKQLQNYVPFVLGGAARRAGTQFAAEIKNSAKKARLIPFEISDTQAYVIEAGESGGAGYFRYYTNGARLEDPPGTPVEDVAPYLEVDLPKLKWVQAFDFLYLAHPSYSLRKLVRDSSVAFTLSEVALIDGPYLPENTDTGKTLTVAANTGSNQTMTASGTLTFNANQVGALWRIKGATVYGYVKIISFTDSTHVQVDIKKALDFATPGTSTTSIWREGAFSTHRGFARAIAFNEQRLWLAGSPAGLPTFYGSVTGSFEDFTPGTADDDAVEYTISADGSQLIQWMSGGINLLLGTLSTEFSAEGGGDKAITPTAINIREQTNHGSGSVAPLRFGNSLFFVQRSGRALLEMAFDPDVSTGSLGFVAPDALILAEHLTRENTLIELAHQFEPEPLVWAVRSDGTLLSLTYDKVEKILAWARHSTDGLFESVAQIPHPTAGREQIWVVVNRTIGGQTKRYVEFLGDVEGSFYDSLLVDSAKKFSGSDLTTLTGLSHLEGKTVQILGDGAVYTPKVVTGGQVTVDPPVDVAEVGLQYVSKLEPLPPEDERFGPLPGVKRARPKVFVRVDNSLGLKINGSEVPFRSTSDLMGQPPPLFTGNVETNLLGWDAEHTVLVEQDQPLPSTILAVFGILNVGD